MMNNKQFAARLNKALDAIEFPTRIDERIETFAIVFRTKRFKAESILEGHIAPDKALLDVLTQELDVSANWLLHGETN
jgi:hypothetical protein